MSVLRLRHPDQPARDIDQGPSTGRVSFTRYGLRPVVVGAHVTGESSRTIANRQTREYKAREAAAARARRAR